MRGYINKISSLEDKALTQVAINLCQENGFKEIALCLEKPTYGAFIPYKHSPFVSDPTKLSIWAEMKKDDCSLDDFEESCEISYLEKVRRWEASIDEQCQRLTDMIVLPRSLRQGVHVWMDRVALEYLSYVRRQEFFFGLSRYFLMNFITREDWKESGRLDETKLAQRLLENERLTLLQRYRIACVYCLHVHIPQLWKRLTEEEKQYTSGNCKLGCSEETHGLVLLWSRHMSGSPENLWFHAACQAMHYGNLAALMLCWKMVKESVPQPKPVHMPYQILYYMSLESLRLKHGSYAYAYSYGSYKENLVSDHFPSSQRSDDVKAFNLPFYYTELINFFLSQMDEEHQLTFFQISFQSEYRSSALHFFLDWPFRDDFLSTINRFWRILPKEKYVSCLLELAIAYCRNYKKENRYCDYRSLLGTLWEKTPEEYKQYVFCKESDYEGKKLLSLLLIRSPFRKEDQTLFEHIFRYQPPEKRRLMIRSEAGENMCSTLIQKEMWVFANWLLEECLPQEEIPGFKKKFIRSDCGVKLCFDTLEENRKSLVEDIIDWSLELDTEKTQWKDAFVEERYCLNACESLLLKGKFVEVERVIDFCLSSDEKKERLKARLAKCTCDALLGGAACGFNCMWKHMDTIVAWSGNDTEKKIRDFKRDLFSDKGILSHYSLVFTDSHWAAVERFYQWFDLSPEEIKKLKKDTIFESLVVQVVREELGLPEYRDTLVASLRWCLTDEEMVMDLKKEVKEAYYTHVLNESEEKELEQLDRLVSELLDGFRKEVHYKTSREEAFVKDEGEKRSLTLIEGESSSPRKRRKERSSEEDH